MRTTLLLLLATLLSAYALPSSLEARKGGHGGGGGGKGGHGGGGGGGGEAEGGATEAPETGAVDTGNTLESGGGDSNANGGGGGGGNCPAVWTTISQDLTTSFVSGGECTDLARG